MTKELKCADLVPGCDFRATGETVDDILGQAAAHAREAHGLEVTPELAEKVKSAIHDI